MARKSHTQFLKREGRKTQQSKNSRWMRRAEQALSSGLR